MPDDTELAGLAKEMRNGLAMTLPFLKMLRANLTGDLALYFGPAMDEAIKRASAALDAYKRAMAQSAKED